MRKRNTLSPPWIPAKPPAGEQPMPFNCKRLTSVSCKVRTFLALPLSQGYVRVKGDNESLRTVAAGFSRAAMMDITPAPNLPGMLSFLHLERSFCSARGTWSTKSGRKCLPDMKQRCFISTLTTIRAAGIRATPHIHMSSVNYDVLYT